MAKTVIIGCRLPHGIVLDHPLDPANTVELAGLNKIRIIGAEHMTTEVDADFWEQWKTVHKDFPALKSGAIFEAKTAADADAKAKELTAKKGGSATGFEPAKPDADGVKTVDPKE